MVKIGKQLRCMVWGDRDAVYKIFVDSCEQTVSAVGEGALNGGLLKMTDFLVGEFAGHAIDSDGSQDTEDAAHFSDRFKFSASVKIRGSRLQLAT
jgi:hypothetical protein